MENVATTRNKYGNVATHPYLAKYLAVRNKLLAPEVDDRADLDFRLTKMYSFWVNGSPYAYPFMHSLPKETYFTCSEN